MTQSSTKPVNAVSPDELQDQGWKPRTLPGFAGLIGPLWTRKEGADWSYGIIAGHEHLNPAGVVHGGLLMSLIDHAMSSVAWESIGRIPCVTVQMDTRFMSAAREHQFLMATARVARATSTLVFTNGQISVDGEEILSASAVLKALGKPS
ncbi:PaaI family thioesterase [Variovorax sp. Root411]|uniref:PaaI family thioesterase n=1 Tax=Variovorax sp. Root411 TaxID=1736530 RepID=UPI0006F614EB|nr:PaaI family thioesterase [Variovorax sp. Root411]KQW56573.1 phenylacetic acid degradation protein [Variovorax sp. Root411]